MTCFWSPYLVFQGLDFHGRCTGLATVWGAQLITLDIDQFAIIA
jgi:hypothetical protein